MDKIRAAIDTNNQKFVSAFKKGDGAGIAAVYTENARILPPGGEMMQGRANIQTFWQGVIDSGVKEAILQTLDLEVGGENMAREIGQGTLLIQQGSETVTVNAKYVVIWKKEAGEWKWDVDIWNM